MLAVLVFLVLSAGLCVGPAVAADIPDFFGDLFYNVAEGITNTEAIGPYRVVGNVSIDTITLASTPFYIDGEPLQFAIGDGESGVLLSLDYKYDPLFIGSSMTGHDVKYFGGVGLRVVMFNYLSVGAGGCFVDPSIGDKYLGYDYGAQLTWKQGTPMSLFLTTNSVESVSDTTVGVMYAKRF
jgi:hypothetical protein